MKNLLTKSSFFLLFMILPVLAGKREFNDTLEHASLILNKIVQAEQKHLLEMGSYISAETEQQFRYNLEIQIPLDACFEYVVHFNNGCYTAVAILRKDVGEAKKGDKITVDCSGKKSVYPSESPLRKYMKSFFR